MAVAASVTSVKSIPSSVVVGTKAQLEGMTKVVPAGIWFRESDTGKMKVSDGVSLYSALSFTVDAVFTDAFKSLMDNAGAANGVATLDSTGKLSMDALPTELTSSVLSGAVKYVADITARDALTDKGGLIIVVDASADSSVAAGTAGYAWNGSAWTKVFESESMDVSLADYFAMSTNTLDDVRDGTTYVRMAKTWKESVDSDLSDLKGRMTTAESANQANATAAANAQSAAEAAQGTANQALTKAGENTTAIANLTTTVSDNKTSADTGISEAKAAAQAAQNKADTNATAIATANSNIQANADAISALEGVVDSLSGGTATDLTNLKNRMTAAEGEIDALQSWQTEAAASITNHTGRIEALEAHAVLDTDTVYLEAVTVAELENAIA